MLKKSERIAFPFITLSLVIFSLNLYSQEAKARIVKEQAVLRLAPNNDSIEFKQLPLGSEFSVEGTLGDWVKVKMPPDPSGFIITGYVHKSFVEFLIEHAQPEVQIKPLVSEPIKKVESPSPNADESYIAWQKNMTRAKSKARSANTMGWLGAGASCLGWGLYFANKDEDTSNIGYLVTGISGIVMALIGAVQGGAAKDEIEALESEGRNRGYVNIGAINGGIALQIGFSF